MSDEHNTIIFKTEKAEITLEEIVELKARVTELERTLREMRGYQPYVPYTPSPYLPQPNYGQCVWCDGFHGSLPCPRMTPTVTTWSGQ